jgi:hypothetical protein
MSPRVLQPGEIKWLLATPLDSDDKASVIAERAGVGTGQLFSLFARRYPLLVQRHYTPFGFLYRLTPNGQRMIEDLLTQ